MLQRSAISEVLRTGGAFFAVGASIAARTFCTTSLDKSATACRSAMPISASRGGGVFFHGYLLHVCNFKLIKHIWRNSFFSWVLSFGLNFSVERIRVLIAAIAA